MLALLCKLPLDPNRPMVIAVRNWNRVECIEPAHDRLVICCAPGTESEFKYHRRAQSNTTFCYERANSRGDRWLA